VTGLQEYSPINRLINGELAALIKNNEYMYGSY